LRKIKTQGANCSGSTFIVFENVKVPVENMIGNEGEGFKYVMSNFNHERIQICMSGMINLRGAIHECMIFAHKRKTFGKRLIDHPVIRLKIAHMVRLSESNQAMLESVLYNFDHMTKK
jgi:alkylation response protein AidB-like acyl-CoA dehydrogenase